MSPCACTLCVWQENSVSPQKVCGAFEVTGKNVWHREISGKVVLVPEPGCLRLNIPWKHIQKAVVSDGKWQPCGCSGSLTPELIPAQRGKQTPFTSMQMMLRAGRTKERARHSTRTGKRRPDGLTWCCFCLLGKIGTLKMNPDQVTDRYQNKTARGQSLFELSKQAL